MSGKGAEGWSLAFLAGVLQQMTGPVDLVPDEGNERAVVFVFGNEINNHISLWPSRFVSARMYAADTHETHGAMKVVTLDGSFEIRRYVHPY